MAESKMAEFKMVAIIKLSQNGISLSPGSELESECCSKWAESKMAEFKMEESKIVAIIKLIKLAD